MNILAFLALCASLIALVLAGGCAFVLNRLILDLREDALRDYWNALSPDQERDAMDRFRKYGGSENGCR